MNVSSVASEALPDRRPVVFIGLDGAEPDLLCRWMDTGDLPTFARLRRDGFCESVLGFPGFGDGAVWPSLLTGVNPARHGRYFRSQFRPRSYRRTSFSVDRDLTCEPFWTTLSNAGRRVAVLDVPFAPLEHDNINGVVLIDWLIHDRYAPPRGWPREFVKDVLRRLGDDPIDGNSDVFPKDAVSLTRFSDLMTQRVGMKESLVTQVMRTEQWDLLATVFTEAHDVGHVCWHLHDPSHPQHDADGLRDREDPIKRLYVETDHAVGRILENASPDTAVVVFAGLGMGPDYTANRAMAQILARLENRAEYQANALSTRLTAGGYPEGITKIARKIDTVREIFALSRRRFFAMPHNENSGAIRINLRGREPTGQVSRNEYDSVCDELTSAFLEIENADTGQPIVEKVVRVDRELSGEHIDSMPDLLVVWSRSAPLSRIRSPRLGEIGGIRSWGRTGDHTDHSLLMVCGDGLTARLRDRRPTVVDVAATIAALQGLVLPGIDGDSVVSLSRRRTLS